MINIEELRIGNTISFEDKDVHVHFITLQEGKFYIAYLDSIFSSFSKIESCEEFKAVLINDDILLNLDFKGSNLTGFEGCFELDDFIIQKAQNGWLIFLNKEDWKDLLLIKGYDKDEFYLHKLQNLYYELKSKELVYINY